jgi:hypothetical protein
VLALLAFAAVALAATMLTVAVAATVLIVGVAVAATALLVRAVLPGSRPHTESTAAPWAQDRIEATVVDSVMARPTKSIWVEPKRNLVLQDNSEQ